MHRADTAGHPSPPVPPRLPPQGFMVPTLLIARLEERSRRRFLAERQGWTPAPALLGRLLRCLPGLLALVVWCVVAMWCVLERWAYPGLQGSDLHGA